MSSKANSVSAKKSDGAKKSAGGYPAEYSSRGREFGGLALVFLSLIIAISLFTYTPSDPSLSSTGEGATANLIGRFGAFVADLALQGFGYSAWLFSILMGLSGFMLIFKRPLAVRLKESAGYLLLLLFSSVALAILLSSENMPYPPGGLVGGVIEHHFTPILGAIGLFLICLLGWFFSLALATNQSPVTFAVYIGRYTARFSLLAYKGIRISVIFIGIYTFRSIRLLAAFINRRRAAAAERAQLDMEARQAAAANDTERSEPAINHFKSEVPADECADTGDDASDPIIPGQPELKRGEVLITIRRNAAPEDESVTAIETENTDDSEDDESFVIPEQFRRDPEEDTEEDDEETAEETSETEDSEDKDEKTESEEAQIIDTRAPRVSADELGSDALEISYAEYELPPLRLLDYKQDQDTEIDREQLLANARKLEETLLDYGIQGVVKEIHPGPVVTMYEFAPARGTKLSRIANLEDDLAMALAALKVRIVAPIPGKSVVGIEVPSQNREMVYFKEIVGHKKFIESRNRLTVALGKDIFGYPVVANLQKMPHLLIAGATGSGKSVGVNSMILSILYRSTPEEVKFILVDPKRLEFNFYEGIPHLLLPVVTDPKQAALALGWVVHEMDSRYSQLSDWGAKNIDSYNNLVTRLEEARRARGGDIQQVIEEYSAREGGDEKKIARLLRTNPVPKKLPFIVVVIDELADLMMVAGKEVELSIARLAQLARASGIHLIVATQRPSTDVLTGLIKNNFPARLSFRVSQKVDSRTILDQNGAEALLGMGDMLYLPGSGELQRIHGAYVSEEETSRVVEFIKKQRRASYRSDILQSMEEQAEADKQMAEGGENDSEYDRAIDIVCSSGKASISLLQRKLKIGYNRSARIIEKMEEDGIVGPSDGVKGRQVYGRPLSRD